MRCKRCGTPIDPLEHFCRGCGKAIVALRQDNEVIYDDSELSQVEIDRMNQKEEEKPVEVEPVKVSDDIFGDALNDLQPKPVSSDSNVTSIVDDYNKKATEIIPNDNLFESYENITEEVEVKPEPEDINKDLNQETNELDIFANDSLVKDSNSEVIHDLNDLTNDYVETNRINRFITSEDKAEIKSEVKNEEIPSESYNIFGDDPFGLEAKKNDNQKENVQSSIVSENKENDIVDVSSKVETVDIEPEALNVEPIATEPKEETNKKEVIVEATKIKEKKKSKLPLVLVIIALILVGVAGVVFYFYTKTSPDKIFTSALNKLTLENSAIDNVRENLSFSINCSDAEDDKILNIVNDMTFNIISEVSNKKEHLKIVPLYKGDELLDVDFYLDGNVASFYLNGIFDKYIVVPLEENISMDSYSDINTLIEEVKKEIKNNLNSNYLSRSTESINVNNKNEFVTKSIFKINSDNYSELLNSLKNNEKIISIISEMANIEKDEASIALYSLFDSFDELSVNLYSRLTDNSIVKIDLCIVSDEEFKLEMTKTSEGFDFIINDKTNGSFKVRDNIYKLVFSRDGNSITFSLDRKTDTNINLELPNMTKKVNYEDLSEKDINSIEEALFDNSTLSELVNEIMSTFMPVIEE